MNRPIRVRIGELVLHGFDPLDRYAVGDAVRDELARTFADHGLPDASSVSLPRLRAGTVAPRPRVGEGIGSEVARVVRGAIRK
jgi:hypothetical protein